MAIEAISAVISIFNGKIYGISREICVVPEDQPRKARTLTRKRGSVSHLLSRCPRSCSAMTDAIEQDIELTFHGEGLRKASSVLGTNRASAHVS